MIAIAFVLIAIMTVFSTSTSNLISAELRQAAKDRRKIQAYYLAEAGLERVAHKISYAPTWREGWQNVPLGPGTYSVTINESGDELQLTIKGEVGEFKILKSIMVPKSPFQWAVFGDKSVNLGNGYIDSYDSTIMYPRDDDDDDHCHDHDRDDDDHDKDDDDNDGGCDGDVATNSTTAGAISVGPNGRINGDAYAGAGGNPSIVISAPEDSITGERTVLDEPNPMNSVKIPADAVFMGSLNSSVVLDPGVYHFSSISLTGNESLTTTGPVRIYVSGPIKIAGNAEKHANSYKPGDLAIFGTDDCTSVSISGNGILYGVVYAPKADITLNGGGTHDDDDDHDHGHNHDKNDHGRSHDKADDHDKDDDDDDYNGGMVYGSLIGKTIKFNGDNTKVHYDEDLRNYRNLGKLISYARGASWSGGSSQ